MSAHNVSKIETFSEGCRDCMTYPDNYELPVKNGLASEATIVDSDQSVHPHSLIGIYIICVKNL